MHAISRYLSPNYDCYFSQVFADHPAIRAAVRYGMLDHTVLGGEIKRKADLYLETHQLKNDFQCANFNNKYDLVLACTDMLLPAQLKNVKTVWVQEGMIDGLNFLARLTKSLHLPRYWAFSTALNGSSNLCDIYCAASEGYKDYFRKGGTEREKIIATGIPNFDDLAACKENNFPKHDYVLAATSDIRECFRFENRPKFIRKCADIAQGRPLVFKLHPNEKYNRAIREIKDHAPAGTEIFTEGNTNEMIANCSELITQYSTVVFVGLVLGKKVHSYFNVENLKKLCPIQNGGNSAKAIAKLCSAFISYHGNGKEFLSEGINREIKKYIL